MPRPAEFVVVPSAGEPPVTVQLVMITFFAGEKTQYTPTPGVELVEAPPVTVTPVRVTLPETFTPLPPLLPWPPVSVPPLTTAEASDEIYRPSPPARLLEFSPPVSVLFVISAASPLVLSSSALPAAFEVELPPVIVESVTTTLASPLTYTAVPASLSP